MLKYSEDRIQMSKQHLDVDAGYELSQTQLFQCLGGFAHQTLNSQFQYILAQETGVIEDTDPEYLHQMRVGFRKLQAAKSSFDRVIEWPKNYKGKDCKFVLRRLGMLRDMDVQLQGLTKKNSDASTPGQQRSLMRLQRELKSTRGKAYKEVRKTLLKGQSYQNFKHHMKGWLKHPQYQAIASLSVHDCAPDLLLPWLSRLLLHPAWLVSQPAMTPKQLHTLHHLRKLCKQLRYQSEFFQDIYPPPFKKWIKEIKGIQSILGQLQDAYVFDQLMKKYQGKSVSQNRKAIAPKSNFSQAHLHDGVSLPEAWEPLRQRYCDPTYRHQLHQLILSPKP